jgi:L-ascorbate metabolism protein UlaG (beta-lactamase superfamily)
MRDRSLYRITYVGHATVLIEVGGARILTDPVLRYRIVHLRRRRSPLLTVWHEQIDAVLISHLHYDHLDLPSLRQVGLSTRLLVPLGAGTLLRQHGFTNVEELRAGERTVVGGVPVSAVAANHNGTRGPLGPTAECLGFVVGSGRQRTYFAGDTDLFPAMHQLEGQVDVGLLPVWGWGPTLGPGHLDRCSDFAARRTFRACTGARPRNLIADRNAFTRLSRFNTRGRWLDPENVPGNCCKVWFVFV